MVGAADDLRRGHVERLGEGCGRKLGLGGFVEGIVVCLWEETLKMEMCFDLVLAVGGALRVRESGETAGVSKVVDMLWTAGGEGEGDKVMMLWPGVEGDKMMLLSLGGKGDKVMLL